MQHSVGFQLSQTFARKDPDKNMCKIFCKHGNKKLKMYEPQPVDRKKTENV